MPLDSGDKTTIREIAFEVSAVIKEELTNGFRLQLELHTAQCPAKKAVEYWPKQIRFLIIGVAIGSGGGVAVLLKLLRVI